MGKKTKKKKNIFACRKDFFLHALLKAAEL